MNKVKTYWDEIKNKPTFFYGGEKGWEVHLIEYEVYKNGKRKTELHWQWPNWTGTDVPRSERTRCRKDVLFKRFQQKTLAMASENKDTYLDLMKRVAEMNEDEFRKAIGDKKGFELRNHIQQKYMTHAEKYASFWRG